MLAHVQRRKRASESHSRTDPDRQQDQRQPVRRRGTCKAEYAGDQQAQQDGGEEAHARGGDRGEHREETHAEDRDRADEAGLRVGEAKVGLDLRDQRRDADQLRPQRECGDEQRDQQRRTGSEARGARGIGEVG